MRKPSAALVVASVALVMATIGTSVAASGYTITSSKQIKPGSISLKALSKDARKELRGARGPQGQPGEDGADGQDGQETDERHADHSRSTVYGCNLLQRRFGGRALVAPRSEARNGLIRAVSEVRAAEEPTVAFVSLERGTGDAQGEVRLVHNRVRDGAAILLLGHCRAAVVNDHRARHVLGARPDVHFPAG